MKETTMSCCAGFGREWRKGLRGLYRATTGNDSPPLPKPKSYLKRPEISVSSLQPSQKLPFE